MDTEIATTDRVRYTVTDGVADVRMVRADKMNALDEAMFDALITTGLQIAEDNSIRAVVLSGEGRAFCAGLDFGRFAQMESGEHRAPTIFPQIGPAKVTGQQAPYVWSVIPVPVIAAIHGVAFGGGLQIALGADIRLATPDAKLSVMETKWGIAPDMTATQLLPELIGRDKAKELTYTAKVVSGEEAAAMGLVTRTCADPYAEAMAMAADIAGRNPNAVRAAKRLLNMAGHVSLEEGFDAEQEVVRSLIGTPNQIEAIRSNMEKRAATYADYED
ncbi:MAG: crotonase/enoyl-CoA hydratase family protein [Antricoccus sp.]